MPETAPENLPGIIDRLSQLRDQKRELEKEVKEIEDAMVELKDTLIARMQKEGFNSARASNATATLTSAIVPDVKDWDELYGYIFDNNAFHLLQRRPSVGAFRELFNAGEKIPGVAPFEKWDISLTKSTR